MRPREFHIWDFPEHKIKVLLKNHNQFLIDCASQFGSMKNLSKFLGLPDYAVSSWNNHKLYIPLWCLKRIVNKLQLNKRSIENKIISYKGINTNKPINNPILPIKETPELFAIITHLIGDGSVNKNQIPMYINSNKILLSNFNDLLKKTFGEISISVYKLESKVYQCCFSKTIVDILTNFYDVKFNSLDAKFPKELFKLPKDFACAVIRAIVDDEGSIRNNRIIISMKNKEIVSKIRDLLIRILGEDSINLPIMRKDYSWYITVNSSAIKQFERYIKLIHPEKKKDVLYAIKKSTLRFAGRGEAKWVTKFQILKFLKNKRLSAKEIAKKVLINQDNIILHLNYLYKQNLVRRIKEKYYHMWSITEEGLSFLEKWGWDNKKKKVRSPTLKKILNLSKKPYRVLLNDYGRKRLFWMIERILKSRHNSANFFKVHPNTISNWKNGDSLLPLSTLNDMLTLMCINGIDVVDEITTNIQGLRLINGKFKLYGGK